jgi:hypothetical protein
VGAVHPGGRCYSLFPLAQQAAALGLSLRRFEAR